MRATRVRVCVITSCFNLKDKLMTQIFLVLCALLLFSERGFGKIVSESYMN